MNLLLFVVNLGKQQKGDVVSTSEEEGPITQKLKGPEELPALRELYSLSCQDRAGGTAMSEKGWSRS